MSNLTITNLRFFWSHHVNPHKMRSKERLNYKIFYNNKKHLIINWHIGILKAIRSVF